MSNTEYSSCQGRQVTWQPNAAHIKHSEYTSLWRKVIQLLQDSALAKFYQDNRILLHLIKVLQKKTLHMLYQCYWLPDLILPLWFDLGNPQIIQTSLNPRVSSETEWGKKKKAQAIKMLSTVCVFITRLEVTFHQPQSSWLSPVVCCTGCLGRDRLMSVQPRVHWTTSSSGSSRQTLNCPNVHHCLSVPASLKMPFLSILDTVII